MSRIESQRHQRQQTLSSLMMEDEDDVSTMATTASCTPACSPAVWPVRERDHQLRIDLMDLPEPEEDDHSVPFFVRRRSEHTWFVSFVVVVNIVVFVATMLVNDCPGNSGADHDGGDGGDGQCFLQPLRRFSFQPIYENPLIGPSSSTLVKMGALQRNVTVQPGKYWPLVTTIWLHAGVIHLFVNLFSTALVGHHLEQEFGPLRAAVIYVLSALMGSVASAVFVEHIPAVASSGPLFGLIGAVVAGLICNWEIYATKFLALAMLGVVAVINFCIGFLPLVDNFSSIGGFLSGILLGVALLFNPELSIMEREKGLFDYDLNKSVKLNQKLDKPILRIIALLIFSVILSGGLVSLFHGIDANMYCQWCQNINCVATKMWSCNERTPACEAMVSDGRLTLTCLVGGEFHTYPFANVSQERMREMCSLMCS